MAQNKSSQNNVLDKFKKLLRKTALDLKVSPSLVTPTQFWVKNGKDISEWEIRKLGGFTNLRDVFFPSPARQAVNLNKKYKRPPVPKLENFTVHEDTMEDLFQNAKLKKNQVFKLVVQPDTHCPEHDQTAVDVFCQFLKDYKPHGLLNLGDFMEMESVSHWDNRSAKPRRLVPEIKVARKVLGQIDEAAGIQCQYKKFLIGNHEFWLQDYLNARIPEVLDGIEDLGVSLEFQDLVGLTDYGYETVPLNEIARIGDAHFIHGYYTGTHHAAKHLQVFGVNIYYGHLHDVQSHSGVSVKGLHESMSLGCLRTLNAPFMKGKPHNWSHAFGIFEFQYDGSYTRYCPIIVDGKFSFGGKVFGA